MNFLDWLIVAIYMLGMVAISVWISRRQKTAQDYYLGGYRMGWPAIGISVMATQCSTNSLLGAPVSPASSLTRAPCCASFPPSSWKSAKIGKPTQSISTWRLCRDPPTGIYRKKSCSAPCAAQPAAINELVFTKNVRRQFVYKRNWSMYYWALAVYFALMLAALAWLGNRL